MRMEGRETGRVANYLQHAAAVWGAQPGGNRWHGACMRRGVTSFFGSDRVESSDLVG